MKKKYLFIIACFYFCCYSILAGETNKPEIKIKGFTQATCIKPETDKAFVFGFDRVRLVPKGKLNNMVSYKLMIDFIKTSKDVDKDGDTPGIIKDAILSYHVRKNLTVLVGKFKTPVGMEFNLPGYKLDVIKRGLGQALVFERNTGAMIKGKQFGKYNFGFAAGVFNAGPNNANDTGNPKTGNDYTIAGQLSLNPNQKLYAELFFGSALTSVSGQNNVNLVGMGVKSKVLNNVQFKGEVIFREDQQNYDSDGTDFYIQSGYLMHPKLEPVIKYEKLDVKNNNKDQANLSLGINIFINSADHHQTKIQLNYIASDLKDKSAIQLMFQGAF